MHNLIGGFQQNVFHGDPRLLQRFIDAVEGILFHQGHRDIHIAVILRPQIFQQPGARSFLLLYTVFFRKHNADTELSVPVCCRDTSSYLLRQSFGNGKPQPCGMSGGFHSIKAAKQLFHLHLIQTGSRVGEHQLSGF